MRIHSRQDLTRFISDHSSDLTSMQRELMGFILKNLNRAAFMNSLDLAREAKVSNSTVIRLAHRLGFSGFPQLQRVLQGVVQGQLHSLERYVVSGKTQDDEVLSRRVFTLEHHVLTELEQKLTEEILQEAVVCLEKRKHVFVAGFLANSCLAEYMAYFLGIMRKNVHLIRSLDRNTFSQIKDGEEDAVAVVYSFPRYPAKAQAVTEILKHRGIPVIGITDGPLSPLAPLADILLEAPMKFISFIDPCAGAFALTHYLLTALYLRDPSKMRERLAEFEEFSSGEDFFVRKDLDIVRLL
jgi:DNA-binding MurR/RpiR family transcriptional regulator